MELEKNPVKVVLEDLVEEMLIMDLVVVKELLIRDVLEGMVLVVEHMAIPVQVVVELKLPVEIAVVPHLMAVTQDQVDGVKLLRSMVLHKELVVVEVDLLQAIAPVLVETVAETDRQVVMEVLLRQILVLEVVEELAFQII